MKNTVLKIVITLIFFFSTNNIFSQIEITPFGGYFFSTNINFYEGQLKVKDNASFGGHLGYHISESNLIEFTYIGNKTTAYWRPYTGYYDYPENEFPITSHYMLIGSSQEVPLRGNIIGFGTVKVGAGYFVPENNIASAWRFSLSFGLGAKIFFNDRIGLRIQGNFHLPLYLGGVGAYCGIGTGGSNCGVSMNSTSAILQGDISAGLIFKINKKNE